jgi:hypothetical protein
VLPPMVLLVSVCSSGTMQTAQQSCGASVSLSEGIVQSRVAALHTAPLRACGAPAYYPKTDACSSHGEAVRHRDAGNSVNSLQS